MKCVRYIGKDIAEELRAADQHTIRVTDETAASLMSTGKWEYISKAEYKKAKGK